MKICNKLWCIIVFLACMMFCLTGCEEEEYSVSSNQEQTAETQGADVSGSPEYNYEEFINDTPQDPSALEENDDPISYEDARKSVEEVESIDVSLEKFEKEYNKKTKITPDSLSGYLDEAEQYLYESNPEEVSYYEREEDSIRIYLQTGGVYIYQPELEGMDAGGSAQTMEIATYQPYISDYGNSLQQYMSYPDDAADLISNAFDMYHFQSDGSENDHNFDDMEVSLENILKFSENNIILWHGHGGYNQKNGCYLGTGIRTSKESRKKYAQDIREETLLFGKGGTYLITASFFDKYFADDSLKNSIIYLAACKSGADDSLVNTLLSKGAMAVFANDGDICEEYNLKVMKTVFERAVQKNGDQYYTLDESLDYAKDQHGRDDGQGTETHLYYQEGYHDLSLNWYENYKTAERDVVLVLDRSGSMDGNPLDQTKDAASKFVDTVLQEESRVAFITYDEEAEVHSGFTRNGDLLHEEIEEINAGSATNIYDGLSSADQLLQSSSAKKKIIVLLTDGLPNAGIDENGSYEDALVTYSEELKKQGIDLYTLGFFSSLSEDERLMAQRLLEDMASPGYHYEVESAEDLVFFFDDMANQISGTKYVYIRIACPVDVKVQSQGEILSSAEDEQKTRASFGSLSFEETEGGDPAKILRLNMEKDYDVQIKGYDSGKMTYTVSYPNQSGEYSDVRSFPDISVSDGMRAASSTEQSDATILQVDSDGDGKYETTYETASNGIMKEKKDHKILYICIGIGAGVVLLVIILIIVVVKSSRQGKSKADFSSMPSFNHDIPPGELRRQTASKMAAGNVAASQTAVSAMPNVTGQIEGLFGAYQGKKYSVTAGKIYKIGRDRSCEIQVAHQQISRIHCKVQLMPDGKYQLTDCSSNGTYYNNIQLEKNKTFSLPKGAVIVLGDPDNVLQLN